MDRAKRILAVLSGSFATLLIICMIMSIASVVMIAKNASDRAEENRRMMSSIQMLSGRIERMEELQKEWNTEAKAEQTEPPASIEVVTKSEVYYVRDAGGKIGIFDEAGNCIKKTDFDTCLFPEKEQQALLNGIAVTSLRDLLALIQDYGL